MGWPLRVERPRQPGPLRSDILFRTKYKIIENNGIINQMKEKLKKERKNKL